MKRMTQKEFKQIFEGAGFDWDHWGWEGILNMISGYTAMLADEACAKGCDAAARYDRNKADYIFDALAVRGYYDRR